MSKEDVRQQIKKEDKKSLGRFILILIVAMFVGGIAGATVTYVGLMGIVDIVKEGFRLFVIDKAVYYSVALAIVGCILSELFYQKGKKIYGQCGDDAEDADDLIELADRKLGIALTISSVWLIVYMLLMGFSQCGIHSAVEGILFLVSAVLNLGMVCVYQKKIVNFLKEMNPEKHGSVFDMKFAKEWYKCCDEAERKKIGEASYQSYRATTFTCIVLWLICVLGMTALNFGILPMIMVIIIWGVSTVTYCIKSL